MKKSNNNFDRENLMKRFKVYEDNRSTSIRNEIIEMNVPLVKYVVSKYLSNLGVDEKELISLGYFGLIDAVETFDADYGASFSTYATTCILNYIKNNLYTVTDIKTRHFNYPILKNIEIIERTTGVSSRENISELDDILNENIYVDDFSKEKIRAYILNQNVSYSEENVKETYEIESEITDRVLLEDIKKEIENLPERQREIIKLRYGYYGECFTTNDIGYYLNTTHQNVSSNENKAIRKLKSKLNCRI